jgi:hypothetical protein
MQQATRKHTVVPQRGCSDVEAPGVSVTAHGVASLWLPRARVHELQIRPADDRVGQRTGPGEVATHRR